MLKQLLFSLYTKEEIDYKKIIEMKKYKKEYHFDNIDLYVYFENEAKEIIENFSSVEQMYVADGHHRLYTSSMLKDKDNVFSCFLSFLKSQFLLYIELLEILMLLLLKKQNYL